MPLQSSRLSTYHLASCGTCLCSAWTLQVSGAILLSQRYDLSRCRTIMRMRSIQTATDPSSTQSAEESDGTNSHRSRAAKYHLLCCHRSPGPKERKAKQAITHIVATRSVRPVGPASEWRRVGGDKVVSGRWQIPGGCGADLLKSPGCGTQKSRQSSGSQKGLPLRDGGEMLGKASKADSYRMYQTPKAVFPPAPSRK